MHVNCKEFRTLLHRFSVWQVLPPAEFSFSVNRSIPVADVRRNAPRGSIKYAPKIVAENLYFLGPSESRLVRVICCRQNVIDDGSANVRRMRWKRERTGKVKWGNPTDRIEFYHPWKNITDA